MIAGDVTAGTGSLRFSRVGDRTVLTRSFAASPLKLLNPKNNGPAAWSYVATYGGGLVGGDRVDLCVDVEADAAAFIATQASTKVYRSDTIATQRLQARLAEGSLLVLLPDPVTCFAGARYRQKQHVRMAPGSNLLLVDWLTGGRIRSGERWQFHEYSNQTMIWRDERLALHDSLRLTPDDGDLAARMDRFNCLALVVICGPSLRAAAQHLVGTFGSGPVTRRPDLLLSSAPLDDDGALLRMAGLSVEEVGAVLRQHLSFIPSLLGDDPWRRMGPFGPAN